MKKLSLVFIISLSIASIDVDIKAPKKVDLKDEFSIILEFLNRQTHTVKIKPSILISPGILIEDIWATDRGLILSHNNNYQADWEFDLYPKEKKQIHLNIKLIKTITEDIKVGSISYTLTLQGLGIQKQGTISVSIPTVSINFSAQPKEPSPPLDIVYELKITNNWEFPLKNVKVLVLFDEKLQSIQRNLFEIGQILPNTSFDLKTHAFLPKPQKNNDIIHTACKIISDEFLSKERISTLTIKAYYDFSDSQIICPTYIKQKEYELVCVRLKNKGNMNAQNIKIEVEDKKEALELYPFARATYCQSGFEVIQGNDILQVDKKLQELDISTSFISVKTAKGALNLQINLTKTINQIFWELNRHLQDFYIFYDSYEDKVKIELYNGNYLWSLEERDGNFFDYLKLAHKKKGTLSFYLESVWVDSYKDIEFLCFSTGTQEYSLEVIIDTQKITKSGKIDVKEPNPPWVFAGKEKYKSDNFLVADEFVISWDWRSQDFKDDTGIKEFLVYQKKQYLPFEESIWEFFDKTTESFLKTTQESGYLYRYEVKVVDFVGRASEFSTPTDGIFICDFFSDTCSTDKKYNFKYKDIIEVEILPFSFDEEFYFCISKIKIPEFIKGIAKRHGEVYEYLIQLRAFEEKKDVFLLLQPKEFIKLKIKIPQADYICYFLNPENKKLYPCYYMNQEGGYITCQLPFATEIVFIKPKYIINPIVYPNPADKFVKFYKIGEDALIKIYNFCGELIKKAVASYNWDWDIEKENISPGLYFYLIKTKAGIYKGKLLIIR